MVMTFFILGGEIWLGLFNECLVNYAKSKDWSAALLGYSKDLITDLTVLIFIARFICLPRENFTAFLITSHFLKYF